jgi:RHS repeat-associated protein
VICSHPPFPEEDSLTLTVIVTDTRDGDSATDNPILPVVDAPLAVTALAPPNVVEGQSFPVQGGSDVVATFDDAGLHPRVTDDSFTATILWGDGQSSNVSTSSGGITRSGSVFSVHGSHTYTEDLLNGTFTVQVMDDGGANASDSTPITVADAPLVDTTIVPTITPLSGVEGAPLSTSGNGIAVATFSDADPTDTTQNLHATIMWGDGHSDTGMISGGNGSFSIIGNHTYTDQGEYGIHVQLTAPRNRGFDVYSTASIDDPPITASAANDINIMPGTALTTVLANFSDPNVPGNPSTEYSATVEWGDGTLADTGTVTGSNGQYQVSDSHTYPQTGAYTARVIIRDADTQGTTAGTSVAVADTRINVGPANGPLQAQGVRFSGVEGLPNDDVLVATFRDPTLTVSCDMPFGTIYWGENDSANQPITSAGRVEDEGNGVFNVYGSHTYMESGSYQVSYVVMDNGNTDTARSTATIADAKLSGTGFPLTAAGKVVAANVSVASVSDADQGESYQNYQATIYWGDGSLPDSGTVVGSDGNYQVRAPSHSYSQFGTYETLVVIKEQLNPTDDYSILVVHGAVAVPANVEGAAAQPPVMTFRDMNLQDPDVNSDYTATITWNDGTTSAGTVTVGDMNHDFQVTLPSSNHTWPEEGQFPVAVQVMDDGGSTVLHTFSVPVGDASLQVVSNPNFRVLVGQAVPNPVATFSDSNPNAQASDFSATIDWGDGTSTVGTIGGTATFSVGGNHSYDRAGTYWVAVYIQDVGGSEVVAWGSGTVSGNVPLVTAASNGLFRTNDPQQADLLPVGEASVALNTGGLRLNQPLDFDLSPSTSVGGDPALVYNSNTTDVRPIVNFTLILGADIASNPPTSVDAHLTFGGGPPSQQVRFMTPNAQPGDHYQLALQTDNPITVSGVYNWSVTLTLNLQSGTQQLMPLTSTEGAQVVVNDTSAIGPGWGIAGVDRLQKITDMNGNELGELWITGAGDSRYFTGNAQAGYQSPVEDFGTLTYSAGTFTYTAKDQTKSLFAVDSSGAVARLTEVEDRHSLPLRMYSYDGGGELTGVQTIDGGITTLVYASGLLTDIYEPGSRHLSVSRDGNNNLSLITDTVGKVRTLTYDDCHHQVQSDAWGPWQSSFTFDPASGLLVGLGLGSLSRYTFSPVAAQGLQTDPVLFGTQVFGTVWDGLGLETRYQIDKRGRQLEMTRPDDFTKSTPRDGHGLTTSETDFNGLVTQYGYNSGDLTSIAYPDGTSDQFGYDPVFHKVTQSQDRRGQITIKRYNATGDLTSVTDPDQNTTTYLWDNTGLMTGTIDPRQSHGTELTTFRYDGNRHLTATINPDMQTVTVQYDANGNPLTTQEPNQPPATTQYDAQNYLTLTIDPDRNTTAMAYDAFGDITAETDPRGIITSTQYDALGLVASTTEAAHQMDARTTTYNRDADGNITQLIDPRNETTTMLYDSDNRRIQTVDPDGQATATSYDPEGNVTATLDARGLETRFAYDLANRQTSETNPEGNVTTTLYDGEGNVTQTIDPLRHVTLESYDPDGRHTQTMDAAGDITTTLYDPDGNVTAVVDGRGYTTTYDFDLADRKTYMKDGAGNITTTVYDSDGRATAVIDARGYTTMYGYDAAGRRTSVTDPNGDTTTTLYDADGNVTAVAQRQHDLVIGTITYSFDDANHKTLVQDQDQHTTLYQYDPDGNLTLTVDADLNTTTYVYDPAGRQVSEQRPDGAGDITTTLYDADGNVTGTVDPLSHTTSYEYDPNDRQTLQRDPLGDITLTFYDAGGNVTATVDPRRQLTQKMYDNGNRLTETIDADRGTTVMGYDSDGNVTAVTDARGQTTSYAYDADDHRAVTEDADLNITTTVYDRDGNVSQVIDARGNTTIYDYDQADRRTAVIDADSYTTTYAYDHAGNVTSMVDARPQTITYQYDLADRRTAVIVPNGRDTFTTTTLYDGDGNVTAVVDARGHTMTYQFDPDGRMTATIDADGYTSTDAYDLAGNLTLTIDSRGKQTHYQYDSANRRTSEQDPTSDITTTLYDQDGNVTATIDPRGKPTLDGFDPAGRQTRERDADGNLTVMQYDADGNLTQVKDGRGDITTYAYDNAGRQTLSEDPNLHITTTVYDRDGNVNQVVDPRGQTTTYDHDPLGRQTAVTDPDHLTTASFYDSVGHLTAVVEPGGNTTTYVYDPAGRRVAVETETTTQTTDLHITTTLYDADGNAIMVIDANHNQTTFSYDNDNRQIGMTDVAKQSSATTGYDRDGNVTATVDRDGRQRSYYYDDSDRLTLETWADTTGHVTNTLSYSYDPDGNLVGAAKDSQGAYTLTYDNDGHLVIQQDPVGTSLYFGYDAAGNRTLVEDSFGGVVSSSYDFGNRLTSREFDLPGTESAILRANLSWNPDDQLTSVTRTAYNASLTLTSAYSYDAAGRLTDLTHSGYHGTTADYRYTYSNGLLGSERDTTVNGTQPTITYTYYKDDELQQAGNTTYGYDPAGNLTQAGNTSYSIGADNQLSSDGTWSYTYDSEGNLTTKVNAAGTSWTYQYDDANQLVQAQEMVNGQPAATVLYQYDVFGNRIAETATQGGQTTTTKFAYDGQNVWADLDSSGMLQMRRFYLEGVDQMFARLAPDGAPAWYLPDRLGSIRDVVDANGAMEDHIDYDAFGNITAESNAAFGDRYKYTGRELDPVTGLQYNRARQYDPSTKRWTSEDPQGFNAGDSNLYRYVGNDPANATDPTGQYLVVENGSQDKWTQTLSDWGLSWYWAVLPNRFLRSSRVLIWVPYADSAKLGQLLENAPENNGWQRNVLRALKLGNGYNIEGDSDQSIRETSLSDKELDSIIQWRARWTDGTKYVEPKPQPSVASQLVSAAGEGLVQGGVNVGKGAVNLVVEVANEAQDVGETVITLGSLGTNAVGLGDVYVPPPLKSGLFGGFDQATKNGTPGEFLLNVEADVATFGLYGDIKALANGDSEEFAQRQGARALGTLVGARTGTRKGVPGKGGLKPNQPRGAAPRATFQQDVAGPGATFQQDVVGPGATFQQDVATALKPSVPTTRPTATAPIPGPRGLAGRAQLPGEVPLGSPLVEGHHNALVAIVDETGAIREVRQLTSMGQTEFESLWPKWKGLSSHTEARAAARLPLQPGEKMVILGQDPPCPSCKGYMNRAAGVYKADIQYQWWENGKLRTWRATRGK